MGKFMRARVQTKITKPLHRGVKAQLGDNGDIFWTDLLYERLHGFCYGCGKLGHLLRECRTCPKEVQEGQEDLA